MITTESQRSKISWNTTLSETLSDLRLTFWETQGSVLSKALLFRSNGSNGWGLWFGKCLLRHRNHEKSPRMALASHRNPWKSWIAPATRGAQWQVWSLPHQQAQDADLARSELPQVFEAKLMNLGLPASGLGSQQGIKDSMT